MSPVAMALAALLVAGAAERPEERPPESRAKDPAASSRQVSAKHPKRKAAGRRPPSREPIHYIVIGPRAEEPATTNAPPAPSPQPSPPLRGREGESSQTPTPKAVPAPPARSSVRPERSGAEGDAKSSDAEGSAQSRDAEAARARQQAEIDALRSEQAAREQAEAEERRQAFLSPGVRTEALQGALTSMDAALGQLQAGRDVGDSLTSAQDALSRARDEAVHRGRDSEVALADRALASISAAQEALSRSDLFQARWALGAAAATSAQAWSMARATASGRGVAPPPPDFAPSPPGSMGAPSPPSGGGY